MQEMTLGEILENLRRKNNLTKQMICEGLCSITALSRYEADLRLPDIFLLEGILERLGGDEIDIKLFASDNDISLKNIRGKIKVYWITSEIGQILKGLMHYKDLVMSNKDLHKQYIYWQLGRIHEYQNDFSKSLEYYSIALACTQCGDFKKRLEKGLLTSIELQVITGIGRIKYKNQNERDANNIFYNIQKYFKNHHFFKRHTEKKSIYIEVLYYLAKINLSSNNWGLSLKYVNQVITSQTSEYKLLYLRESLILKKEIEEKLNIKIEQNDNKIIALELLECNTLKDLQARIEDRKWNFIVNQI